MHKMRHGLFFVFFLLSCTCMAQADTSWKTKPALNISGFIDVYYAYDFNKPKTSYRQPFLYNHNRHNEVNLNLGFLKLALTHAKYHATMALQAGTYVNDNYAAEPETLKNFFEASAGLSLNHKNNLWLDAGIFGSHIGFEGAPSIDNWTLTRSLLAENSPYYSAGAKLTFNKNDKLVLAALFLNGWQRIQKVPGNSLPSFGTQVKFSPDQKVILNWSTFVGTNDPDSTRRMRYFNNFYAQVQLTKSIGLITGFDIGAQQKSKKSAHLDYWFSPVIICRYTLNEIWALAFRAEYYQDEWGIIIPKGTPHGFKTTGLSLNLDYAPIQSLSCRIEGRYFNSRDRSFAKNNGFSHNNYFIVSSIAVRLGK